jgi:hypothetical protein
VPALLSSQRGKLALVQVAGQQQGVGLQMIGGNARCARSLLEVRPDGQGTVGSGGGAGSTK